MKANIIGFAAIIMKTFDFPFGLMLVLKHTESLSKSLQASSMSAVEARCLSQLCISVFQKMRTDSSFDQFGVLVIQTQQCLEANQHCQDDARHQLF